MNFNKRSNYFNHLVFAAFILTIVTIPLAPKWGAVSLIFLGVLGIINILTKREWERPPLFIWCLIIIYSVRALWLFNTNDLVYGLKSLESEAPIILIPLIYFLLKIYSKEKRALLLVYVITALGTIFYAFLMMYMHFKNSHQPIAVYLENHFLNPQFNSETNILTWKLAHYSFISAFIVYGLNILLYWCTNKLWKLVLIVPYLICTVLFIILTGSRSGLILVIVSLIVYLLTHFQWAWNRKTLIVIFIGIMGSLALIWSNYKKIDPARHMMVEIAFDAFLSKPFFGYGTGSGKEVMHNESFEYHFTQTVNHPHNQYLSELIQFGIIGTLPFLFFIVLGLKNGLKPSGQIWPLFSIMLVAATFMLVEAPLNSNKGILPLIIAVCLLSKKPIDE